MSNFTKFNFSVLDILGKNYLSLALDVEIHINAEDHDDTIKEENISPNQKKNVMKF